MFSHLHLRMSKQEVHLDITFEKSCAMNRNHAFQVGYFSKQTLNRWILDTTHTQRLLLALAARFFVRTETLEEIFPGGPRKQTQIIVFAYEMMSNAQ